MGYNALQDLNMAGVQWELTEQPVIQGIPKTEGKKSSPESTTRNTEKNIVVPAVAPVVLDSVTKMLESCNDIDSLMNVIKNVNHPLRSGATNTVLPNIAKNPNGLIIITDMPNTDDDLSGRIFSGNTGDLLDKMLSAIQMSRENVSLIPLVFWKTPGGRTPLSEELKLTRPILDKMIDLLKPQIVITFGTLAATEIGQTNLTSNHGTEIKTDKGYTIIPLFHPNYLILKPSAKKDVWAVLQNVQKMLKIS
ncbi:MAG: uracil-DNA glycosylase [Alphaproteobacteria bacterium]|nr:uracil-DNA glycosylase [Alphaproteobacteria bacterium]